MSGIDHQATPTEPTVEVRVAKAMSHPLRMRILEQLKFSPASPVDLSRKFGLPIPNVSYHFEVLRDLGCIKVAKTGQVRGAVKTTYESSLEMLISTEEWAKLNPALRARITAPAFKSVVDKAAEAIDAKTMDQRPDRHLSVVTLPLGERAWKELADELDEVLKRFYERAEESSDSGEPTFPATLTMLAYESPPLPEGGSLPD